MTTAIPKDSIVLVTGVNGFIGSHVADQLLLAGYRVRGTARNESRVQVLISLWEKKYGPGRFELAVVPDLTKDGAFDEAVKGVSGVVHVASVMTFLPDPNKVIPGVVAGVTGILRSAARETSVKRFVFTSSSTAARVPISNKEFTIDSSSWNEAQIKEAWEPPPYHDERKWAVYGASKAEAEKAVWRFVKEERPHFVVNTVLPNMNLGKPLAEVNGGSTGAFVPRIFKGDIETLKAIPPLWFVDVQDTARIHVAALVSPDVNNERIFAFAEPFIWNDVLRILRKLRPDHKFVDDFVDDDVRDLSKVANERAEELLRRIGRPGFTRLEESVAHNIEGL